MRKLTAIAFGLAVAFGAVKAHAWLHPGAAGAIVTPAVTSVLPNNGGAAGGSLVNITGTGFTGVTSVSFGSNALSCPSQCVVNSSTSIFVPSAPAGSGTVNVTVTNSAGTSPASSTFTYADYVAVFQASGTTGGGTNLGGTEGRSLVGHYVAVNATMPAGGGLCATNSTNYRSDIGECWSAYAGIGYWDDSQCTGSVISQAPVILAVNSPTGTWGVEKVLDGTCHTVAGDIRFDVVNSLFDITIANNASGTPVNTELLVASGVAANVYWRTDSTGSWPSPISVNSGTGSIRALGTHTDTVLASPPTFLLIGNDAKGIFDATWNGSAFSVGNSGNVESWNGCTTSVTACTNQATDWTGAPTFAACPSGCVAKVTASGSAIQVTWTGEYPGTTNVSGTITVTGFAVGTGGSGAANGNVSGASISSSTYASNTATINYTGGGSVNCGTGCSATINANAIVQTSCGLVIQCNNACCRVTAITECPDSGTMTAFAVVQKELWVRTDGSSPQWTIAAVEPQPWASQDSNSGLRGLTCINYNGGKALLAADEGTNGAVWRIDPSTFTFTLETTLFGNGWFKGYGIQAYNDMSFINGLIFFGEGSSFGPPSGHPYLAAPPGHIDGVGGVWVRTAPGSFTLYPTDSGGGTGPYASLLAAVTANGAKPPMANCTAVGGLCPSLVSTRGTLVSQFPTDVCQDIFTSYMDMNNLSASSGFMTNTATIVRQPISDMPVLNSAGTGHC